MYAHEDRRNKKRGQAMADLALLNARLVVSEARASLYQERGFDQQVAQGKQATRSIMLVRLRLRLEIRWRGPEALCS